MSQKQRLDLMRLKPLNAVQGKVLKCTKNMVIYGAAGTGKSLLAVYKAMRAIELDEVDKLIIVRSAVPTREVGYLPGSLDEKVKVYEVPYEEIFTFLYDNNQAYRLFKNKHKQVEFMTSSYVRGITLEDCHIIVDEFQNMNFHELDSIITRLGENCRISFCGDARQSDLKNSGIDKFLRILAAMPEHFEMAEFEVKHIVRSGLVKEYLTKKQELYD